MTSFIRSLFPFVDTFSMKDLIQLGEYVANYLLCEERYFFCPNCIDINYKKNGHVRGVQRGVCYNCGKSFKLGSSSLLYRSRLPKGLWHDFIIRMFREAYFQTSTVPKFDCINKNTASRMQIKIKESLIECAEDISDEIDEIIKNFGDENYSRVLDTMKYE